jgi:hypothetical protein
MNKFIITFGSGQLPNFNVRPNDVILVIEANTENDARQVVVDNPHIGIRFSFSYPYEGNAERFKNKFRMFELTMDELMDRLMEKSNETDN